MAVATLAKSTRCGQLVFVIVSLQQRGRVMHLLFVHLACSICCLYISRMYCRMLEGLLDGVVVAAAGDTPCNQQACRRGLSAWNHRVMLWESMRRHG
jgi:hypothetical protein